MQEKKEFTGWVKNRTDYPEGRTSLLVVVNQVGPHYIVSRHVSLCIRTVDAKREGIKQYDKIAFQAKEFRKWRYGVDRFLGCRQSNNKESNGYKLPALSTYKHPRFQKLKRFVDPDFLAAHKVNGELYLAKDVNPIWSLVGFDKDSVGIIESYKPDQPIRLKPKRNQNTKSRAKKRISLNAHAIASAEADKIEALEAQRQVAF